MVRKKSLVLIFVVIFVIMILPIWGCRSNIDKLKENVSIYQMDMVFHDKDKLLTGESRISYFNSSDEPMTEVCFLLYANGFRKDAAVKPINSLHFSKAYPNGFSTGGIEIHSVTVAGALSAFTVGGEDMNILTVPLLGELFPNERIQIDMGFTVKLPNARYRMGYAEDTVNLGNFYPIAAVYENGKFLNYPYYSNGDPFYSDVSNYEVTFRAPTEYIPAFSGIVVSETAEGSDTIYSVKGDLMRDFAVVLSKKFKVSTMQSGKTSVQYFSYQSVAPEVGLKCAVDSLETFNELYGEYPYPTLSVVECDFIYGGMEYPALVYISDDMSKNYHLEVITHEIAHQWWYATVGNNQITNAWMDEGLAEYSTALFFEENKDYYLTREEFVQRSLESYRLFSDVYKQVVGKLDTSMNRPINLYLSELEYSSLTYNKSTLLFDEVRKAVGKEKFLKGMQRYYSQNKYTNATPAHLIGALEYGSNTKLTALFESFVTGETVI